MKARYLIAFWLLGSLLIGCSNTSTITPKPGSPTTPDSVHLHPIEELATCEEIEASVKAMLEEELAILRLQKGFYLFPLEEQKHLLLVSLGRQHSPGCTLEYVEHQESGAGLLTIIIDELLADTIPDGVYYPHALYLVAGLRNEHQVKVQTLTGEDYPETITKTAMEMSGLPILTGIYQAKEDDCILVSHEGVVESLYLGHLADLHYGLNLQEGDAITFSYLEDEEGRLELRNLQKQ